MEYPYRVSLEDDNASIWIRAAKQVAKENNFALVHQNIDFETNAWTGYFDHELDQEAIVDCAFEIMEENYRLFKSFK